jgi:uncharacterized protein (TIGR03086 family)
MAGMDDVEGLARFDRAVVVTGAVFDGVKVEQWGDPTPCTEWTVRDLMNHLVGGTRQFISLMTGGGPLDRSLDYLGSDPAGSFRDAAAELRAIFAADGALERFRDQPNRIGRARMFADASIGLDDPGMLAFARLTTVLAG